MPNAHKISGPSHTYCLAAAAGIRRTFSAQELPPPQELMRRLTSGNADQLEEAAAAVADEREKEADEKVAEPVSDAAQRAGSDAAQRAGSDAAQRAESAAGGARDSDSAMNWAEKPRKLVRLQAAFDEAADGQVQQDVEQPVAAADAAAAAGAAGSGAAGSEGSLARRLMRSTSRLRMPGRQVDQLAATEDERVISSMR
jgi:hypothetical protein